MPASEETKPDRLQLSRPVHGALTAWGQDARLWLPGLCSCELSFAEPCVDHEPTDTQAYVRTVIVHNEELPLHTGKE